MNNILTKIKELKEALSKQKAWVLHDQEWDRWLATTEDGRTSPILEIEHADRNENIDKAMELIVRLRMETPEIHECLEEAIQIINRWPNEYKPDDCMKFLEKWGISKNNTPVREPGSKSVYAPYKLPWREE